MAEFTGSDFGALTRQNKIHLVEVPLDQLVIPKRELRVHPPEQVDNIARSIKKFGWISPIVIDENRTVIAGIARIRAAKQLGLSSAPAVQVEHLSPVQVRAYRIADNKLAEAASWEMSALQIESVELIGLGIDPVDLGFPPGELDVLLHTDPAADLDDNIPEKPSAPTSRLGDIWVIGQHRLVCGDSLRLQTYTALLGDLPVDAVFTDAPYNVKIDKNVCGLGRVKHDEFVQGSGELSPEEFWSFLRSVHDRLAENTKPGGIIFSCMDWRSISQLIEAGKSSGLDLINLTVWDKGTGGMGSLYRSQHELIAVFKKPGEAHTNNVQLGKYGRNRTNVWTYAGMNTGGKKRDALLKLHPTVKPVALVADAIKDVTKRSELVLDCFGGSGTTMIAAEETGRRAALIELDPKYCDVIITRMREAFGLEATLADTGQAFDEVTAARTSLAQDEEAA